MKTYGQYCPIARASEVLAERWTPIILRDLLLDLGQRVAHERIDARATRRQRGKVVVVHDVDELELGVHRTGQPCCHAGRQKRRL